MEFVMMNIGLFALLLLFMGVTFVFPLTTAYVVAVVFMVNVGVAGYILTPAGGAWLLVVLGAISVYMADVLVWIFIRRQRRRQRH